MKGFFSIVALLVLAVPAVAQDGLVDRVARLEAKVDKLIALLEKQSTPQLAHKPASPAACPCVAANGVCVCADPFAASQATAPTGYRMVCNGGSCQLVPVDAYQSSPYQSIQYQSGACANGSCGGQGLIGRIFRRR